MPIVTSNFTWGVTKEHSRCQKSGKAGKKERQVQKLVDSQNECNAYPLDSAMVIENTFDECESN